jgi:recombination protein RecT
MKENTKKGQATLPLGEEQKVQPPATQQELSIPARFTNLMMKHYRSDVLPDLLRKHGIDEAQFLQVVSSEFKKNRRLQDAFLQNPQSLFASILSGAEIGLIPSELLGEFYLIPRRIDNKETITPLIGYKGLVKILMRSGHVTRIHAECVYEGDVFSVEYGLEPRITHSPKLDAEKGSINLKFVYVVAKLSSGDYQFVVLSKGDIIKIQQMSKYNNELYFNDRKDPQMWMVKKTALIQLAKLLPKDYYGTKAVELDSHLEGGAILSLDDDNKVKIIDGKRVSIVKQPNVMNTFANLPDLEEPTAALE